MQKNGLESGLEPEHLSVHLVVSGVGLSLMREEVAVRERDAGRLVIWDKARVETTLWFAYAAERVTDRLSRPCSACCRSFGRQSRARRQRPVQMRIPRLPAQNSCGYARTEATVRARLGAVRQAHVCLDDAVHQYAHGRLVESHLRCFGRGI